jgi:hypothetical protein
MAIKKKRNAEEAEPGVDFLSEMVTLGNEDIRLNVLVYGLTGVGKTRFLGSAQKCEFTTPMFLLDIEGGTLSISGSKIEVFRPQNFVQVQQAYNFLRYENTKFKSVGIDSLTEMQQKLSMGDILGILQDDASYTNLAGHVPANQYDWLSSGEQMRRNIRAFKDLAYLPDKKRRIHVFFTALERTDEKRSIVCPALPGALGMSVGASVDVLARMSVRTLSTGEENFDKVYRHFALREFKDEEGMKYLAKARTPENIKFPKELWRPTVSKLLDLWTGKEKA